MHREAAYLDLLREALDTGECRDDRTGVGTRSLFGRMLAFDLTEGFPLLTTKRVHFKSVLHELMWFLRGETNVRSLQNAGVSIWDEWADAEGELGPVYGKQWRSWAACDGRTIDQIAEAVRLIREDPTSRRIVVSAWNPADLPEMALAPCHILFQFSVRAGGRLDCALYQLSADLFLGAPFNIASYSALLAMVAHVSGLTPGRFTHFLGDAHLYANHLDQAQTQLERTPKAWPRLVLNPDIQNLFDFRAADVTLEGYDPHPAISAPVAV